MGGLCEYGGTLKSRVSGSGGSGMMRDLVGFFWYGCRRIRFNGKGCLGASIESYSATKRIAFGAI
jgi:hypothetical protein